MHLLTLLSALLTLVLTGCSGHGLQDWADESFNNRDQEQVEHREDERDSSPSSNKTLNSISPSKTATSQGGTMQKSLDSWSEKEWTPAMEKNETIRSIDDDDDRSFTLQEYVDKAGVYMQEKPKSSGPSHKEKLDRLPVIGE